jgi:hypothetical protein
MIPPALDMHDEPYPTRVLLLIRIIEPLFSGKGRIGRMSVGEDVGETDGGLFFRKGGLVVGGGRVGACPGVWEHGGGEDDHDGLAACLLG